MWGFASTVTERGRRRFSTGGGRRRVALRRGGCCGGGRIRGRVAEQEALLLRAAVLGGVSAAGVRRGQAGQGRLRGGVFVDERA